MKQHPNILQEIKTTKTIRVLRVDLKNWHVHDKLSPNLEPMVNDVQMS
jgi:hypothetical protein